MKALHKKFPTHSLSEPRAVATGPKLNACYSSAKLNNFGFDSKVMRHVRFGFGAGCAAVAVPRRRGLSTFGLCPWCGLWPNKTQGHSPNQGQSPGINLAAVRGHSHRRTSGGKAEATPTSDF